MAGRGSSRRTDVPLEQYRTASHCRGGSERDNGELRGSTAVSAKSYWGGSGEDGGLTPLHIFVSGVTTQDAELPRE